MERPLRFGIFMAPFHPAGQNPTLALERDLELLVRLDELREFLLHDSATAARGVAQDNTIPLAEDNPRVKDIQPFARRDEED